MITQLPCNCACTRKNILLGLLVSSIFIIFLTNQMISIISPGRAGSFFQIQNFIHIGFFYDDYENLNGADSLYKTLPMEDGASCNIPNLEPFQLQALKLIHDDEQGKEKPQCINKAALVKFYVDHQNLIRVNSTFRYWDKVKCCYNGYFNDEDDRSGNKIKNETFCKSITSRVTRIPIKYDFINVKCFKQDSTVLDYQDQFEFFKLRRNTKSENYNRNIKSESSSFDSDSGPHHPNPNILFLGLDSISHMNFIRSFPKSHQYLSSQLNAIEFYGVNKISVSTQGNLLAMVTGCKLEKNSQNPEKGPDPCKLIWKSFKTRKNYTILRAEDDFGLEHQFFPTLPQHSLDKNGHAKSQTCDYNWLPYIGEMKRLNVHKGNQFTFGCFDYQFVQNLLMEHILKVAEIFKRTSNKNNPYFHFTWTASTAHDVIGYARYLDDPLYSLLKKLKSRQYLQNTILILTSDHGMAYGTYSRTNEGSIESRMPLLYFVFPTWFQSKYTKAIENLKLNTMRLTTPFDLHETLKDLLNLDSISNDELVTREFKESRNKGLSLFGSIPLNRTCETAGIPEEFCICWTKTIITSPESDPDVQQGVSVALNELNNKLLAYPKCSQLKLNGIEIARKLSSKLFDSKTSYEIVFKTSPGNGLFEVSLAKGANNNINSNSNTKDSTNNNNNNGNVNYRVLGEILRVNAYGKHGPCLDEYYKTFENTNVPYLINSACYCT